MSPASGSALQAFQGNGILSGRSRVERDQWRENHAQNQKRSFNMQATSRFATFCAVSLAAAGLLVMPAANAQQQSPSAPSVTTPKPTTTPTNIPDKKLDAAAAAVKKVTVIKNNYDQQLAQAPVDEKKRLQGEAGDAMAKAVTDQGLSIEEYTTILTAAQKDPAVRDKLLQRMK
jgi:hypothetical protein